MIPLAWLPDFFENEAFIDSYGEAIEIDFFERGWNILDWFSGRYPLSQLRRIADKLPDGSHYRAEILEDEELARYLVENNLIDTEHQSPSWVGYDRYISKLDQIYDLVAGVLNQNGAKLEPAERPVRAVDVVLRERSFSRHLDRVSVLLPPK